MRISLHRHTKAFLAALGVFGVGLLATCLFVIAQTREVIESSENLYVHPFSVSNAALEAALALESAREKVLAAAISRDPDKARAAEAAIRDLDRSFRDNMDIVIRDYLGDVEEAREAARLHEEWTGLRGSILEIMAEGDFEAARAMILTMGTPAYTAIHDKLEGIVRFARSKAAYFMKEAKGRSRRAEASIWLVIVGGFLGSSACAAFMVTGVQRAIRTDEDALNHKASHDPLTGLANRGLFMERLGSALDAAGRHGASVGLVYIDLDGFKAVNDTLGHDAGDEVLVQAAGRLVGALRGDDTVARLGGDEFVVLLPNLRSGGSALEQVAAKVRRAMSQPFTVKGAALGMGASIGVAASPHGGAGPEELLASADSAMYRAKARARCAREGCRPATA